MIVSLNNALMPAEAARISPFDRGFTLGDGVYEAMRLHRGCIVGLNRHIARLTRSLSETRIHGVDPAFIAEATHELARANGLSDAFVYWQISRGTPAAGEPVRTRLPTPGTKPTIFGYVEPMARLEATSDIKTIEATTQADTRWDRGHIKATSLLGGVLAALESAELGGHDAVLIRDGLVTEGPSNNLFVSLDGQLVTPALDSAPMLAGVTRALLLDAGEGIIERPVRAEELTRADEIMLTGTRTGVAAITRLDGRWVGQAESRSGAAGPEARRLLGALMRMIEADIAGQLGADAATADRSADGSLRGAGVAADASGAGEVRVVAHGTIPAR